ncbi:malate dehydrogenase [Cryptosporidium canis]|uniref:L-lactate dehydrogenase n=1 Tax=Cryptosporidium canis TaxID=195482 RepID=A0ABQ8P505_9CRYT|nr:malate dehydrogenase [Cryptosporidium canis]KAJ1608505.1 malate dehydrogenase [Cryptosporidium canis]
MRKKISIIGAGQIGSTIALLVGQKDLGDVYMFDIVEGIPQGKALDLNHCMALIGSPAKIYGENDYEHLQGSDVVIITAGIPRKPNMTRSDLLTVNAKIVGSVAENVGKYCPGAFVICITNPLDAMVYYFKEKSGIPANRVCGMSGVLDSARFRCNLSRALGVRPSDVSAIVVGGHGDEMIPLTSSVTIGGISLSDYVKQGKITPAQIDEIIKKTAFGGGEIVGLLKTGSAFYAPAASAVAMAQAYLHDTKSVLVCSTYLSGQYGVSDMFVGVPVIIGKDGIEEVVTVDLNDQEKSLFSKSVESIQALLQDLKALNLQ